MEKARFLHADLDEGGLHAGQHARDFAFINIAGDAHFLFSFDEEFGEKTVFDDGDAALLRRGIDKNFLFHMALRIKLTQ